MNRILIIEDEEKIARFVELELMHEGYAADKATDGRTGLEMAETGTYDLIVLDIMLPQLSGIEVLRRLRRSANEAAANVPVILLTARDAVTDKVTGLDMGANDYMTKPFAIEELLARIRVGLKKHRTAAPAAPAVLTAGPITLDPGSYSVTFSGKPVQLTKKEFDLLRYLMQHAGQAVSRDALLTDVWGYDYAGDTNVVDVYIRYLRCKLDDPFRVKLIHTVRGVGYLLRAEE